MNKRLLFVLTFFCLYFTSSAQSPPKREFRGAWIATYFSIDWPNRLQTPAQQRTELIKILDHHQATGINAIFLQMRSQCDAMYPSTIEPWSYYITGQQGKAPTPLWDPLAFAIEECHKRGMELHAWLNPYRAIANYAQINTFAPSHVARQHPEWLLAAGAQRILDPGLPEVRDYVTSVVRDIVERYDVDGIHFDDYFYPNAAFNDDATFAQYARGFTNRANWRRDNVNLLIQQVNETVSSLKPWVKFGVSPSGIYRNSTDPAVGTPTKGLEHYTTLYADTRKWVQQGWVDYLAPQVYWYIGYSIADYSKIVPWWSDNTYNRHMYIGMAGFKVGDAGWTDPQEIPDQVRLNRSLPGIKGQAIYNTNSLRTNKLGFRNALRDGFYRKPALQPTMPWKDNTPPGAPTTLTAVKYGSDSVVLEWTNTAAATGELDKARQFVIYRSQSAGVDINDAENLLLIANSDSARYSDTNIEPGATYYYTVTAVDRLHNESTSSNTAANLPPVVSCPANQELTLDASCSAVLPDYRLLASVTAYSAYTLAQVPAPGTPVSGREPITVTLTATDKGGNATSCSFTVTPLDVTPPVISTVTVSAPVLFPPNHKMRNITLDYTATDNCGPVTTTLSVSSNEPVYATGDGHTGTDWLVVDDHHVKLRAERSGTGDGRVYTLTITTTDAAGNTATASTTVSVPHDNGAVTTHTVAARADKTEAAAEAFSVKVLPNPTTDRFTLITQSSGAETLTLKVMDATGRVLERRSGVAANGTLYLGSRYRPGIYYVEIAQGDAVQTLKLVKQAH